jgi:rare lipoprotein A
MASADGRRPVWRSSLAALLVLALSACAAQRTPVAGPPPAVRPVTAAPERPTFTQVGVASWYGPEFHGQTTANGERFDMRAMTAAHRSLPFGTIVRVTDLATGRAVRVRINDRGPLVAGRILDLSRRAAGQLGVDGDGTARVRLEVVASDQSGPAVGVAER